jgi:RNA polymerase sigma-70 factor (ECF subfamily)
MDATDHFQALVLGNLDSLYGFALALSDQEAAAEDLLQETLLKAFRAFSSYRPELSFKTWTFAIMKHASIDRARRRQAEPLEQVPGSGAHEQEDALDAAVRDVGGGALWAAPLDPEALLVRRLTVEDVREAIRRLPAAFREVLQLREIEGLSYQDIASALGCPIGTVMSRLSRARTILRSSLRETSETMRPRN